MTDPTTAPAPPQPTAEHEKLKTHCGTWNVACKFYMDPSQPPMEVQGKETIEMFGGFFTTSLFEAEMFGFPFQGRATLGFDPKKNKYVSSWFDTSNPQMYYFEGNFDEKGEVLEMSGEGFDCMSGQLTNFITREYHTSDDERTFEMFMTAPDGSEVKMFTHVYTRA